MIKTFAWAGAAALLAAGAVATKAADINDAQITHIAYTAGNIDIAAAKQALAKSNNAKVREFAQEMVRDHEAVNDKALALVKKLGVTPEDNPTSKSLSDAAAPERTPASGALWKELPPGGNGHQARGMGEAPHSQCLMPSASQ